jgi:hypothetical protein
VAEGGEDFEYHVVNHHCQQFEVVDGESALLDGLAHGGGENPSVDSGGEMGGESYTTDALGSGGVHHAVCGRGVWDEFADVGGTLLEVVQQFQQVTKGGLQVSPLFGDFVVMRAGQGTVERREEGFGGGCNGGGVHEFSNQALESLPGD